MDSKRSGARERGITISQKPTSGCLEQHPYQTSVDTPGPPTLVAKVERNPVDGRRVVPARRMPQRPDATDKFGVTPRR